MADTLVNELVEAGVHFGHRASRWNPKMAPYIYARKNGIHIIDVRETIRGLLRAKKYLAQVAAQGSLVLFVGTKKQAGPAVERESLRCHMPFVAERWLGGCLTNFRTIRSRLGPAGRSREDSRRRPDCDVFEEDAVGPGPRISQDVPQPERHPHAEPHARMPGDHRSEQGKERDQGSADAGHHHVVA